MREPPALEAFRRAGAATVYEANDRTGSLDPGIRRIVAGAAVAGPAFTVACARRDNLALHRAVAEAAPGDVLVVCGHAESVGYLGDILAEAAMQRGIAGVVVDGCVRDVAELERMRFGVWARGLSIRGATKTEPGALGGTACIGGVEIAPGDLIVADGDGVCAIARQRVPRVLDRTRARLAQEEEMRRELRGGRLTLDLLDLRKYL
jgi:4-hydroxy-4-methyl-2-oxoglutarate aldolase